MRPLTLTKNVYSYADASVIIEFGNTKVLCAVTIQRGVPLFMRGTGEGWLTAEYAMLPTATQTRISRESSSYKRSGRSVEISRFIGRCLRSSLDLKKIGESTITIDCDVLQADGSTRTAAITGASYALRIAEKKWLSSRRVSDSFIKESIAAVSVGKVAGSWLIDLDYEEDSIAEADFNVVITQSGRIIELQGCAEREPIGWQDLSGMQPLVEAVRAHLFSVSLDTTNKDQEKSERVPFFSLKSRLEHPQ